MSVEVTLKGSAFKDSSNSKEENLFFPAEFKVTDSDVSDLGTKIVKIIKDDSIRDDIRKIFIKFLAGLGFDDSSEESLEQSAMEFSLLKENFGLIKKKVDEMNKKQGFDNSSFKSKINQPEVKKYSPQQLFDPEKFVGHLPTPEPEKGEEDENKYTR